MGKATEVREVDPVVDEYGDDEVSAEAGGVDLESEDDLEEDSEAPAPVVSRRARTSLEDSVEAHTVASRRWVREQVSRDIEAYLARGGQIQVIEADHAGAVPQKPVTDYGNTPF